MRPLAIRTPSLLLRHFVLGDAPAIMALNGEPSTRRWLPSHVYATLDEAVAALRYLITCYATPGDPRVGPYVLAIDHSDPGRLLGHVGFSPLDTDVEVSYAVAEAARNQGYGVEALVHACRWGADVHDVTRVVALTATDNLASRRTLARASFAHERDEVRSFQGSEPSVSRYRWQASSV